MSDVPPQPNTWLSDVKGPMPAISTKFLVCSKNRFSGLTADRVELRITDGTIFAVLKAYSEQISTAMDIPVGGCCVADKLKVQTCPPKYLREGFLSYDIVATGDSRVDPADGLSIAAPTWPFLSIDDLEQYLGKNVDIRGYISAAGEPVPKANGRVLQELTLVSMTGKETRLTIWDKQLTWGLKVGDLIDVAAGHVKEYQGRIVVSYCLTVDIVDDAKLLRKYRTWASGKPQLQKVKRSLGEGPSQMDESQLHLLGAQMNVEICEKVTGVKLSRYDACPTHNKNIMTFNNRGHCSKCGVTVEAAKRHFAEVTVAGKHPLRAFDEQLISLLSAQGFDFLDAGELIASGQVEQKIKELVVGKVCKITLTKGQNTMKQEVLNICDWEILEQEDEVPEPESAHTSGVGGSPEKSAKMA